MSSRKFEAVDQRLEIHMGGHKDDRDWEDLVVHNYLDVILEPKSSERTKSTEENSDAAGQEKQGRASVLLRQVIHSLNEKHAKLRKALHQSTDDEERKHLAKAASTVLDLVSDLSMSKDDLRRLHRDLEETRERWVDVKSGGNAGSESG